MKTKYLIVALAMLLAPVLVLQPVRAGDAVTGYSNLRVSASKASAVANSNDSITFTINFFLYKCASGVSRIQASGCDTEGGVASEKVVNCGVAQCQSSTAYPHAEVSVSGSGNTLSSTVLYPNVNGTATFTLKSSVAQAKTVKLTNGAPSHSYAETATAVTFTMPPPAAAPAPKPPAASPPPPAAVPSTPQPTLLSVDNTPIDISKPVEITQGKPLVLGGKTVPNGVVKLYIFSEPQTATITADKDGNWTHTISSLPAGDHHVESEVTDPATGRTSARASVLSFTVKAAAETPAEQKQATQAPAKEASILPKIVSAVAVLLVAAGAGFFWWKKKRAKQPSGSTSEAARQKQPPTQPTPSSDADTPHNE